MPGPGDEGAGHQEVRDPVDRTNAAAFESHCPGALSSVVGDLVDAFVQPGLLVSVPIAVGELTSRYPALTASVFDRPVVCDLARQSVKDSGAQERVTAVAGDFWQEDLPRGYDVMLLSNVLHDWSPEQNLVLAGKCHAALEDGGALVVTESFVNDDGTGPVTGAVSSLRMLIETAQGQNYSCGEYESVLRGAGFTDIARVDFLLDAPGANGALVARKR